MIIWNCLRFKQKVLLFEQIEVSLVFHFLYRIVRCKLLKEYNLKVEERLLR